MQLAGAFPALQGTSGEHAMMVIVTPYFSKIPSLSTRLKGFSIGLDINILLRVRHLILKFHVWMYNEDKIMSQTRLRRFHI